jgi:Ca-activated chloride channel family protein
MFELPNDYMNWFSTSWFSPTTLKGFHWDNFLFLYLIPIIPFLLFFRWGLYYKFRQKFDIALLSKDLYQNNFIGILRFTPYIFMVLFECMILLALARPQKIHDQIEQWSEGIDILLLMDVSESMLLEDFKPNRLEASKNVAQEFVKGRQHDKIGLIIFSGDALSLSPLTSDYRLLNSFINNVKQDIIPSGGTAIGNAIGVGINRLRESNNKSKVMILLSDGDNTAGNLDPLMAAKIAYAYNIRIYTIGIGKDGLIPYGKTNIESSLNEATLRKIAETSEGKYYRASDMHGLKEIFQLIDKYEKAEIKETKFQDTDDYYQIYLIWGIIFFLCWLFLKNTFLSNALED